MIGFLRAVRPGNGLAVLFAVGAAVFAWGVATVLLTLASLLAYAFLRLPVLLALHDAAAVVALVLVALGAAGLAARGLVGEG